MTEWHDKIDTNNEIITTEILDYWLNTCSLDILYIVATGYSTCQGLGNS